MKRNAEGVLRPFYNVQDILRFVPQLNTIASITVKKLTNIDSSNIDPLFWTKLARTIDSLKNRFDGFVITHGTDTMAYTASALSFALGHIDKQIVFTGAQKPVDDLPSDATQNLINATIVASTFSVGIAIVFGSKILQGNRATKVSESSLEAFDSPMMRPLGEIALEPVVTGRRWIVSSAPQKLLSTFDPHVLVIQITPGLSQIQLKTIIHSNVRGIIFEAFGPGNMPDSLIDFLRQARKKEIPVAVLSQCRKGITRMQLYEVGLQALREGAMPGGDMTVEAASTKLMWILSQTRDMKTIKEMFGKNIAGEVTV